MMLIIHINHYQRKLLEHFADANKEDPEISASWLFGQGLSRAAQFALGNSDCQVKNCEICERSKGKTHKP